MGSNLSPKSSQPKPGVSVVICCHNSAKRIAETLFSLQSQVLSEKFVWEVLIVDNNCFDETVEIAQIQWEKNPVTSLRVVVETALGLSNARVRGINEAQFEIISFIDDDNHVNSDWVCQLPGLFKQNPNMAAVGGLIAAEFELVEPSWFEKFKTCFAVGPQAEAEGRIEETNAYLCGAGLTIRKSVLNCLFRHGFRFDLVGRQGRNLLCSEDLELCLALRMAGWELHYYSSLKMSHFMPDARMSWTYLRRLSRGVGISLSGLKPYYVTLGNKKRNAHLEWLRAVLVAGIKTLYYSIIKLSCVGRHGVGREDDLHFERVLGLLYGLINRRKQFVQSIERLRDNSFYCCSPITPPQKERH